MNKDDQSVTPFEEYQPLSSTRQIGQEACGVISLTIQGIRVLHAEHGLHASFLQRAPHRELCMQRVYEWSLQTFSNVTTSV